MVAAARLQLLVLAPALAGGLLSVVLLAALVVPLLRGVLQRQDQLGQLQQQADELPFEHAPSANS